MALKSKLAQTIMKFGISMLDYPRSTESQLKSEGTLGGLSSLVECRSVEKIIYKKENVQEWNVINVQSRTVGKFFL